MTVEEFKRCAQIQDDYLHERGCRRPKEMIINADLRKSLDLGPSVVLKHAGEIPLVDDTNIPLFMFRGFIHDPTLDTRVIIEKTTSVGRSETAISVDDLPLSKEPLITSMDDPPLAKGPVAKPTPNKFIPMSQRKRAIR